MNPIDAKTGLTRSREGAKTGEEGREDSSLLISQLALAVSSQGSLPADFRE
jgi:hypothetical protein